MKFETKPVQVNAYQVGSDEGTEFLHQHTKAFESKNLWDCWEIRTPEDLIEIVTKGDWVILDDEGRLHKVKANELLDKYVPLDTFTNCLNCVNPTGHESIAALLLRAGQEKGLCPDCINTNR